MLKNLRQPLCLLLIAVLFSCKKKEVEPTPDPCITILPTKVTFMFSGVQWCANSTSFADLGVDMTIHGENQDGSTFTMELDSLKPGNYQIREDYNHFLFTTNMADAYESTDDNPGTLVITSHDSSSNVLKGTFNVTVRSPLSGSKAISSGSFTAVYTE